MTPFQKHGHAMPWEAGFSIKKVVMISSQPSEWNFGKNKNRREKNFDR
jgi:hypothetical protein